MIQCMGINLFLLLFCLKNIILILNKYLANNFFNVVVISSLTVLKKIFLKIIIEKIQEVKLP